MSNQSARLVVPLQTPVDGALASLLRSRLLRFATYVSSVDIADDTVTVTVGHSHDPDWRQRVAAEIERIMSAKPTKRSRPAAVVKQHHAGTPALSSAEVHRRLLERGDVVEFAEGLYGYGGEYLRVMRLVAAKVVAMSRALGAEERVYPWAMPVDTLYSGRYLQKFPHHVFLLAHFGDDLPALDLVAKTASEFDSGTAVVQAAASSLQLGELAAAPLVCYHVFRQCAGRQLPSTQLFVAKGRCMRCERAGTRDLGRLTTFTLVECVAIGAPDDVRATRQHLLTRTAEWAQEIGLSFRVVSATDPFFRIEDVNRAYLQERAGLKYELVVSGGGRDDLAVASFNLHCDALTRAFAISGPTEVMFSGCVGWGIERWALALMCRHGIEVDAWPLDVMSALGSGSASIAVIGGSMRDGHSHVRK
jgi:seryl-tRNA synthetase